MRIWKKLNKSIRHSAEEIYEEIYEEGSSHYEQTPFKETDYEDAQSFNIRPSSQHRETSGKLKSLNSPENEIPDTFTSEDKSLINSQLVKDANEEMEKVFNQIEYTYVDQSIKQRKWVNRSVMQKRDQLRLEDHRRKEAQNSLKREFNELEIDRNLNKIHTNKKSRKLAQKALKKKIRAVVDTYSQNGYLAFDHFLNVLYMLQITQNIGKLDEDYLYSERIKRVKEEKDSNELQFCLQLWNKVNCYLFNYVDSIILIDFLMILWSSSKNRIPTAQDYIGEISRADDLPIEEIEKNRERNADLIVDHVWTVEQLFQFHKHKLNWPTIVTRTGFSIDRGLKKNQLYQDYFKECTFRPQITKKAHEVEEKKIIMNKVDHHLNVFDANPHDIESMGNSDRNSGKVGSSNKPSVHRNSRFMQKNMKIKQIKRKISLII